MKQSNITSILGILERRALRIRSELKISSKEIVNTDAISTLIPGLTLVFLPFEEIDGLIYKINTSVAIIAINSNRTLGQANSILGHELYHYFFSKAGTCVCKTDDFNLKDKNEEYFADCFSSMFLMSPEAISDFINDRCEGVINEKTIVMLEHYFKTSRASLLYRLRLLNYLTEEETKKYNEIDDKVIIESGLPLDYFKSSINKKETFGYYNKILAKLLSDGKIGENRYQSFLNDTKIE